MHSSPYRELNEHHAKLDEELRQKELERNRSTAHHDAEKPHEHLAKSEPAAVPQRPRQSDVAVELLEKGGEQTLLTPQQQAARDAYWQSWDERLGDGARRTPEHQREVERLVLKAPTVHAQDLEDLIEREARIEQDRQARLEHEQAHARSDDAQADRQKDNQTAVEMTDARQAASGREKEHTDKSLEFEARRRERIADTIARRQASRENERGGRED